MFDPNIQKNQHFVPVFWQKRFSGEDGRHHRLENNGVEDGNPKKQMSADWIYTTFDKQWNPSNFLEQAAGKFETQAAAAFRTLNNPGSTGSIEDQVFLRWFIAFSACRHPDTMSTGHRIGKRLAYLLADVHSQTLDEFCCSLEKYNFTHTEADNLYNTCRDASAEQLLDEAIEIEKMLPYDPILPQQMSIDSETIERTFFLLWQHDVTILDAPSDLSFILGDTPFPPELGKGYTIPISSHMALLWEPGATNKLPDWTRRTASIEELEKSNQLQFNNALNIVIGPSKDILEKYKS